MNRDSKLPTKIRKETRVSMFPPLFKTMLEISVRTRQEKEIKSVYIVKVDVKLPCFVHDIYRIGQNPSRNLLVSLRWEAIKKLGGKIKSVSIFLLFVDRKRKTNLCNTRINNYT